MNDKKKQLPLNGCTELVGKFANDFLYWSESPLPAIPASKAYKVTFSDEAYEVVRSARKAALSSLINQNGFVKHSFDARRTDQESERNPRSNLQYWNRSQQYIEEEDQKKLESFARLLKPLDSIKDKFGKHPEYFQSYARKLYENVKSVLKIRESDMDVFRPQMDYLEQLLYARYRISMEDLEKMGSEALGEKILSKDEDLLKRGSFMHITGDEEGKKTQSVVKDGDQAGPTQDSIVNAIFGNNKIRRDGEKSVERTITITIRDEVID